MRTSPLVTTLDSVHFLEAIFNMDADWLQHPVGGFWVDVQKNAALFVFSAHTFRVFGVNYREK